MATFKGTEDNYLIVVLEHIKNNKPIKISSNGKYEILVEYSSLLKKIYNTKDLDKAMKLMKTGRLFIPVFKDKNTDKYYKWTHIYKGTFSTLRRKNSISSSNINEVFTLFFLKNDYMTLQEVIKYLNNNKSKYSGINKGENNPISNKDLLDLILEDSSAKDDIKIAVNNAKEIKKDINGKTITEYYWQPKHKTGKFPASHPVDIVIKFNDGSLLGYSNKAISGVKDTTPKFNTSVTAFYSNKKKYQTEINNIIDESWVEVQNKLPDMFQNIFPDIKKEPYTEGGSKTLFKKIARYFEENSLDFYKEDFYYPYRNTFITKFCEYLRKDNNLENLLNIIYTYTYESTNGILPYKLLVGSTTGSTISDISDNEVLKSILSTTKLSSKKITYDGKSQSFTCEAVHDGIKFYFNVTCRTRSSGGWSGKSLYMNTPGIKLK